MYHGMARADHQQWRNNNEFDTHQRNEASRNQAQDDIAFMQAADRNGWLSDVAEFNPHSSLSSDQRQEVLNVKTRLMGKAAYSKYKMQRDMSDVQDIDTQSSADDIVGKMPAPIKAEFRNNPDFQVNGVYTPEGLAAIERYKEGQALKAEIGDDEFARLTAPIPASGVSGPTRAAMMSGKPYTHPIRSKEYLGGSMVVPEENALKEMRKLYTQKKAAYQNQFTEEEASWSKYGIKVTAKSGEVYKREQANEKLDFVAGQLTSDAYLANYETMEEAMSDAFLSADMVMGDVPVIRNPSDVPDLVSRGKLSQGDLYWSTTKKSWNRVPSADQPQQQGQPTTGGPVAPPVDPENFSREELIRAAGIDESTANLMDSFGIEWTDSSDTPEKLISKEIEKTKRELFKLNPETRALVTGMESDIGTERHEGNKPLIHRLLGLKWGKTPAEKASQLRKAEELSNKLETLNQELLRLTIPPLPK